MLLFEILLTVLIENWGNTMGWNNVQKNPNCLKQMSDAWKVNVVTSCRSAAATPIWGNTIQINQPCYQDHLHWRISTVRLCCIKPYSRCWSQSAGVYWPYSSDTGASIHYTNFPLWSSVSHTHWECHGLISISQLRKNIKARVHLGHKLVTALIKIHAGHYSFQEKQTDQSNKLKPECWIQDNSPEEKQERKKMCAQLID